MIPGHGKTWAACFRFTRPSDEGLVQSVETSFPLVTGGSGDETTLDPLRDLFSNAICLSKGRAPGLVRKGYLTSDQ
jgi:hypothetical protein